MKLLTAKEAAKRLGYDTSWFSRHREDYDWIHKPGGRFKINEIELEQFIENSKTINKISNKQWQLKNAASFTITTSQLREKGSETQLAQAISNLRKSLRAN